MVKLGVTYSYFLALDSIQVALKLALLSEDWRSSRSYFTLMLGVSERKGVSNFVKEF